MKMNRFLHKACQPSMVLVGELSHSQIKVQLSSEHFAKSPEFRPSQGAKFKARPSSRSSSRRCCLGAESYQVGGGTSGGRRG